MAPRIWMFDKCSMKRPRCWPEACLQASDQHLSVGTAGFEPTTSASRRDPERILVDCSGLKPLVRAFCIPLRIDLDRTGCAMDVR